jgi:hypothetical protein
MLLLIAIFSINKSRGYANPSWEIIVIELCSTRGCPLEEAREHCFLNQSVIYVVVLLSFMCYYGYYASYITVIPPFLAFYFCFAYFLYLEYYMLLDIHPLYSFYILSYCICFIYGPWEPHYQSYGQKPSISKHCNKHYYL